MELVMRGLDPRIHAASPQAIILRQDSERQGGMDCRVKPGNDECERQITGREHLCASDYS